MKQGYDGMKENLLILGAGQYGAVAKEIAVSTGRFGKIDFLDDHSEKAIDRIENYPKYAQAYPNAVVAIGNAEIRLSLIEKLEAAQFRVVTLISPAAYVSPSARLSQGTIVEPMAVINPNTLVGMGTIVCAGAIVNHDATVGAGCLLQCGSIVAAGAMLKPKTTLDYGVLFHDR